MLRATAHRASTCRPAHRLPAVLLTCRALQHRHVSRATAPAPARRQSLLPTSPLAAMATSRPLHSRATAAAEADAAVVPPASSSSSSPASSADGDEVERELISADRRFWWLVSGVSGALAVGLGAFGAHGLKARVSDVYYLDIWQTASQYHLAHALAIGLAPLAVGLARRHRARTGRTILQSLKADLFGAATAKPSGGGAKKGPVGARLTVLYRNWSARSFLFGTVFFSGSLYVLTLTENRKWGAVTPIGGVGFILGWIFLAIGL